MLLVFLVFAHSSDSELLFLSPLECFDGPFSHTLVEQIEILVWRVKKLLLLFSVRMSMSCEKHGVQAQILV